VNDLGDAVLIRHVDFLVPDVHLALLLLVRRLLHLLERAVILFGLGVLHDEGEILLGDAAPRHDANPLAHLLHQILDQLDPQLGGGLLAAGQHPLEPQVYDHLDLYRGALADVESSVEGDRVGETRHDDLSALLHVHLVVRVQGPENEPVRTVLLQDHRVLFHHFDLLARVDEVSRAASQHAENGDLLGVLEDLEEEARGWCEPAIYQRRTQLEARRAAGNSGHCRLVTVNAHLKRFCHFPNLK
jgi:hypothetical protein